MRHAGLDELQTRIKIGRRNSSFSYADDNTLNGRKPRVTKEPLNESEELSERVGLRLNIKKIKIMAQLLHGK